jgi:hypothetical protein
MAPSFINSILKNIRQQDANTAKYIVSTLPKEDMDDDNETPQGKSYGQFIDIEKMKNKHTQTPYIKGSFYNIPVRIPSQESNDKQIIDRIISSRKSFTTLYDSGLNYSIGSSSHLSFNSIDSDSQSKNIHQYSLFQTAMFYRLELVNKWCYLTNKEVSVSTSHSSLPNNMFDLLDVINGLINVKTTPYLIICALLASGFIITSM